MGDRDPMGVFDREPPESANESGLNIDEDELLQMPVKRLLVTVIRNQVVQRREARAIRFHVRVQYVLFGILTLGFGWIVQHVFA